MVVLGTPASKELTYKGHLGLRPEDIVTIRPDGKLVTRVKTFPDTIRRGYFLKGETKIEKELRSRVIIVHQTECVKATEAAWFVCIKYPHNRHVYRYRWNPFTEKVVGIDSSLS